MGYRQAVRSIYSEQYAREYRSLYIDPWQKKHSLNRTNLERILERLPAYPASWLDLACGPAWHFSAVRKPGVQKVGVDLSLAQLRHARRNCPEAVFVLADLLNVEFASRSLDLVTNFWAGYCYLASADRIGQFLKRTVAWLRPGGCLYMEVLRAEDLAEFNCSQFSNRSGFRVAPRNGGYIDWWYEDRGGRHEMTSPPLEFFIDAISGSFGNVDARHDAAFMVHLIASDRKNE